jgi:hypothetical protein
MAKPNRLDVARTTGELSLPTKAGIADALGVAMGSAQFEQAFGKAADRGLVEPDPSQAADGTERWVLSKKGRSRLASQKPVG